MEWRWGVVRLGAALSFAGTRVGATVMEKRYDSVEKRLKLLNSPEGQQETGLTRAWQDEKVVNQLDLTFAGGISPQQRYRVMREAGQQFLTALFMDPGIPSVAVVERDDSGTVLNRAVVNLVGLTTGEPPPQGFSTPMPSKKE